MAHESLITIDCFPKLAHAQLSFGIDGEAGAGAGGRGGGRGEEAGRRLDQFTSSVQNRLSGLLGQAQGQFQRILSEVRESARTDTSRAEALLRGVVSKLSGSVQQVGRQLGNVEKRVEHGLEGFGSELKNRVSGAKQVVLSKVEELSNQVESLIKKDIEFKAALLTSTANILKQLAGDLSTDAAKAQVRAALEKLTKLIQSLDVQTQGKNILRWLESQAAKLRGSVENTLQRARGGLANLEHRLENEKLDVDVDVKLGGRPVVDAEFAVGR